jgi:hypothetical protein
MFGMSSIIDRRRRRKMKQYAPSCWDETKPAMPQQHQKSSLHKYFSEGSSSKGAWIGKGEVNTRFA